MFSVLSDKVAKCKFHFMTNYANQNKKIIYIQY
jgi:hypothetical protein